MAWVLLWPCYSGHIYSSSGALLKYFVPPPADPRPPADASSDAPSNDAAASAPVLPHISQAQWCSTSFYCPLISAKPLSIASNPPVLSTSQGPAPRDPANFTSVLTNFLPLLLYIVFTLHFMPVLLYWAKLLFCSRVLPCGFNQEIWLYFCSFAFSGPLFHLPVALFPVTQPSAPLQPTALHWVPMSSTLHANHSATMSYPTSSSSPADTLDSHTTFVNKMLRVSSCTWVRSSWWSLRQGS